MREPPSGIITFLFTDIEGSTKLWEHSPEQMATALARHDALVRIAAEENGGYVFKTMGDAFCIAFDNACDALTAAVSAQRALVSERWPEHTQIAVRMALHTGSSEVRAGDYVGQPLNRVARLLAVGHGKQILLSAAAAAEVRAGLPAGTSLRDRGSHRLKDLQHPDNVFEVVHPDLPAHLPPLRSLSTHPNNLPQQLTSFVGRDRDIAHVKALLGTTRLLTLTGSGGSGKTRLAIQVGADVLECYQDGVWFLELAALVDPQLLPQTIAAAFGLREEVGKVLTDTLSEYLRAKRLLLVLDNCEHLVDACARLADAVVRQCPGVVVLATSRERLSVLGELAYRVPSLSMPDPKRDVSPESLAPYEAVRLFAERAQVSLPGFAVTNQNARALASVCWRLDGIPLAIELAAARIRSLSVEQLDQRLGQRFRLLTGGSRTALPRQQTLRSLIDWSYNLLSTVEQVLFCRFAVFAGGWTLEAAVAVCDGDGIDEWDVLELLTSLADKSLLVAEERNGVMRYRLLETLREYGVDRLRERGDEERWRERHLAYFVALAEEGEPHLRAADQQAWLDRLEMEHDNLRAALTYAGTPGDEASGLRLVAALWRFWLLHGHFAEGRSHLSAALSRARGQEESICAKALSGAAILAFEQGDYVAARPLCEDALTMQERSGDRAGMAMSLGVLASLILIKGDYASARALFERSLAIRRELGDHSGVAASLSNLGLVAADQADYPSARALYEESLAIRRQLGDKKGIATSLTNMGLVVCELADYASARMHLEESLVICQELGDRAGIADSLCYLGNVATQEGALMSAHDMHAESAAIRLELGDRYGIAGSLEGLANVALALRSPLRAACIWGAAERLRADIGSPLSPGQRRRYDARVEAARVAAGNDTSFETAWREGSAMTLKQAIAYAEQANAC